MKKLTRSLKLKIRKNPYLQDWLHLCCNYILPEDFIEEFIHLVNWYYIFQYQKISEEFTIKHRYRLDWNYFSSYGNALSESFIRKYKNYVHWSYVSQFQKLSESFMLEVLDYIDPIRLRYNALIEEGVKDKIIAMKVLMS